MLLDLASSRELFHLKKTTLQQQQRRTSWRIQTKLGQWYVVRAVSENIVAPPFEGFKKIPELR